MDEIKNKQKQHTFVEMRQKLMQRFLDGALDQPAYERMLADIEVMERAQNDDSSPPLNSETQPAGVSEKHVSQTEGRGIRSEFLPAQPSHEISYGYPSPVITMVPVAQAGNAAAIRIPGMPMIVPGMMVENGQNGYPSVGYYGTPAVPVPPREMLRELKPDSRHTSGGGKFRKDAPSPEIPSETIQSLGPNQPLEIWWHYPLKPECATAWRDANVPIKLSLTMNASVTDESLQCLAEVPKLRELNLTSTSTTDAGLAFLSELPELDSLILTSTQVQGIKADALASLRKLRELTLTSSLFEDEGIQKLAGLKTLELLKLDDTQVTDEGMEFLRGLASLRILNLQGSIISDVGMEHLARLVSLEKLYVGGTIPFEGTVYESPITNDGIEYLAELVHMRTLHVNDTQLTDPGLRAIQDMNNLSELNIADTLVTDGCLYHLRKLERLRSIIVDGTSISLSGIRKVLGADATRWFHGASVGTWRKLGSFLKSPWSRKN